MKLLYKLSFLSCVDFLVCAEYINYVTAMDCSCTLVLVPDFDVVSTADELQQKKYSCHFGI